MSDNKNFLDKMFDGMEAVVGGIERSKELSGDSDTRDVEDLNKKYIEVPVNPRLVFVMTTELHMSEGHAKSFLCGSFAEAVEVVSRKTEIPEGRHLTCGTCIRILYSRYLNS